MGNVTKSVRPTTRTLFYCFYFLLGQFDIAFVIDASRSVGGERHFKMIIQLVKQIVNYFVVSQTGTRIGVVLYDDLDGYLILDFKSTFSTSSVIQALDNIRYPSVQTAKPPIQTAFSHALILANEILFNVQYRAGASKYLITVTAGMTFPKAGMPSASLRKAGVDIYSVDLSPAGSTELQKVVTPVPAEHIIRASYDKLVVVSSKLTSKLKRELQFLPLINLLPTQNSLPFSLTSKILDFIFND